MLGTGPDLRPLLYVELYFISEILSLVSMAGNETLMSSLIIILSHNNPGITRLNS